MKGFLRKVLLIASFGAALTFFGCNKDFTQDIEDVRNDLTTALQEQNSTLTAAINQAKEDAQKYADEAAKAAKDYADQVAAAAKADAIEEAKKLADAALQSAKTYADNAAKSEAAKVKEELLKQIKTDLENTLADAKKYTDDQIKDLKDELLVKITELSSRIDGIDKEINTLKSTVEAQGLKIDELVKADEAMKLRLDALEAFQKTMEDWKKTVDASLTELAAADKALAEKIATESARIDQLIKDLEDLETRLMALILKNQEDIAALQADVLAKYNDLQGKIDALKATMDQYKEELDAADQVLQDNIDQLGEDLRKEMAEAIDALDSELRTFIEAELADLKEYFDGEIAAVRKELSDKAAELYKYIDDEIAALDEKIAGIIDSVEETIKNRITSISLIPEMYIGGVETINIPSIAYLPKSVSDKEIPSALNIATNILPWYEPVYIRYHVAPSNVTVDCIGAAEYLTEYAKFVKSAGEESFLNVDLGASKVNSKNELEVAVKRAHAESMLPFTLSDYKNTELAVWPTVALSLSIAEDYRVDDVEASVSSEYVLFTEEPHMLHITKNADPCDIVDGCTTYYTDYASACAGTDFIPVVFDSTLDLSTLVSTHIAGTDVILNRDQIKGIGLDYRFVIPTLENLAEDGTDQQKFIRFADESNEVIASFVPGGHENSPASIGRTPVVRVELYDVNTNQVVDVKWIQIKWVRESIPAQDFGLIKSFEQILDCSNLFEFRIDWETINDKILAAGLEMSHEQFVDLYGSAKVSVDAENTTINPAGYARAYFVKSNSPVQPQTSVYRITVDYRGLAGIIDEILKDGKASRTVTVKVVPNTTGDTQVGEIKFSVNIDWTLPAELLPTINGYKLTNSWTVAEQLAMVEPIGFSDITNKEPGVNEFVRYNFNMKGLFNLDTKGGFVANLVPEQEGLDFSCRTWDMQFSSETEGYSENTNLFRPTFFTNPAILYAKDTYRTGYELINKSNRKVAAKFVYPPTVENWYNSEEKVNSLYFSIAKYADNDQVTKLLNPVNVQDNARVKLPVNVWSMLTTAFTNVYKVKTFDMWVVSPVQMPELKQQNLSLADINMNVSQVILPTGTALLSGDIKDFQGNKIDTDAKRKYYGVVLPAWQIDNSTAKYEILTDIIIDENNNITVNPDLDPNDYATAAEAKRNMRSLSKAGFDATFEGTTLKVTNKQGAALTQTVTFWIPVAYEHAYQKYFAYIPVTYKPNSETPAN